MKSYLWATELKWRLTQCTLSSSGTWMNPKSTIPPCLLCSWKVGRVVVLSADLMNSPGTLIRMLSRIFGKPACYRRHSMINGSPLAGDLPEWKLRAPSWSLVEFEVTLLNSNGRGWRFQRSVSDRFHHKSGSNATCTDLDPANRAVLVYMSHLLEIGIPNTLCLIVGMTHVVSHMWGLATEFALPAHDRFFLSPKRCDEQEPSGSASIVPL